MGRCAVLLSLVLFSCSEPVKQYVEFGKETSVFQGLGATIYVHDIKHFTEIKELNLRFVRIEPTPNWAYYGPDLPFGKDISSLTRFVENKMKTDWRQSRHLKLLKKLKLHNIKSLWVMYQLPFKWLDPTRNNAIRPEHEKDLLNLWLAQLLYYRQYKIEPYAIEISNEPDGSWNGRIPANAYHRLVVRMRRLLDEYNFKQVKIAGPGFSSLNLYHDNEVWLAQMPDQSYEAMGLFSVHIWDEIFSRGADLDYLRFQWQPFRQALQKRNRQRSLPLFISEYATEVIRYNGKVFNSPRTRALYTASETHEYGNRLAANTLVHIDQGAAAPIVWRLSDEVVDNTAWGLLAARPTGYKRPGYTWLKKMVSTIRAGQQVHNNTRGSHPHVATTLLKKQAGYRLHAINTKKQDTFLEMKLPAPQQTCQCNTVQINQGDARQTRCDPVQNVPGAFKIAMPATKAVICDFN